MKINITIDDKKVSAIRAITWIARYFAAALWRRYKSELWVLYLGLSMALLGYDFLTWQFWAVAVPTIWLQVFLSQ